MKLFILVPVVMLIGGCASSTSSPEMTLEEGAKIECRNIQQSGTILPKRICNNKATWAAIEERNQEQAESFDRAINDRYRPVREEQVSIPTRRAQ